MSARIQIYEPLSNIVSSFRDELSNNRRFRRLSWLVVYILICYGIIGMRDFANSLESSAAIKRTELSRLTRSESISPGTWEKRKYEELVVQSQLLESCWMANGPRLASADMQTILQKVTKDYSLRSSRLTLSEPESINIDKQRVWRIRAQVSGRISQARMPSMIKAIEYSVTPFSISKMHYVEQVGSGSLTLTLVACFRDEPDE